MVESRNSSKCSNPLFLFKKINYIPILLIDADARLTWEFTSHCEFSVKTLTWANNESIFSHSKAKFLNSIWKLNLTMNPKLVAWKFVRNILLIRNKLRHLWMNVNGECLFSQNEDEDINHFIQIMQFTSTI